MSTPTSISINFRFSLRTGKWEEAGKLRVARRSPGVVSYRGVVYAVGYIYCRACNEGPRSVN